MSLRSTLDALELALLRRERYAQHEHGAYNARFEVGVSLAALLRIAELEASDVRGYARRPDISPESREANRAELKRFKQLREKLT